MADNTGTAVVVLGIAGLGGWWLLRGQGKGSGAMASVASGAAGRGESLPLSASTTPARSASSATLPDPPARSSRWGREVRESLTWGPGSVTSVVAAGGGQASVRLESLDESTQSAVWRLLGGAKTFPIPWDTDPSGYTWDPARGPLGEDGGATAQGSATAVEAEVGYAERPWARPRGEFDLTDGLGIGASAVKTYFQTAGGYKTAGYWLGDRTLEGLDWIGKRVKW